MPFSYSKVFFDLVMFFGWFRAKIQTSLNDLDDTYEDEVFLVVRGPLQGSYKKEFNT